MSECLFARLHGSGEKNEEQRRANISFDDASIGAAAVGKKARLRMK